MKHGLKALIFSLIFVFGIFNVLSLADTEYSLTVIQNGMRVTTQKAPGTNITLGIKPESGVKGWKVEQRDITINNNY